MDSPGEAGNTVLITDSAKPLLPSDYEFVVRKNGAGGEIAYTRINGQVDVHTGDANFSSHGLSSIYLSSDGQYELFDFHIPGTHYGLTDLTSVEFVVRDNENNCVNYVSPDILSSVLSVHTGDANLSSHGLSSIYLSSDGQYELFNFHLSDTVDVRISDLASVDFVLRNPNDGKAYVQYGKLCIDIAPDSQG